MLQRIAHSPIDSQICCASENRQTVTRGRPGWTAFIEVIFYGYITHFINNISWLNFHNDSLSYGCASQHRGNMWLGLMITDKVIDEIFNKFNLVGSGQVI